MAYPTNFIPEIWSKKLQKIFDRNCVMTKLCNRDHEGEVKQAGDVVHVRSFGEITIKNYTREMTITFDSLQDPMSDLLIDQEKYFAFQVDDVDKAQSDIGIMNGYSARAADAITRVTDQSIHAVGYAGVASANVIGSSGSPVTLTKDNIYSYIVEMGRRMDESNVKGARSLVVDPRFNALLVKSPEFTRATGLGDKVVTNGRVGTVLDFDVHMSTNLNSVSGNRPILALTKDLISHASQISKVEHVRPTNKFVDAVKGLYVWGSKVFTNSALVNSSGPDGQGAVLWVSGT